MGADQIAIVTTYDVSNRPGYKTWNEVHRKGQLMGYVRTVFAGQQWRTTEDSDWRHAASDWNRSDPEHGHAVWHLIQSVASADKNENKVD